MTILGDQQDSLPHACSLDSSGDASRGIAVDDDVCLQRFGPRRACREKYGTEYTEKKERPRKWYRRCHIYRRTYDSQLARNRFFTDWPAAPGLCVEKIVANVSHLTGPIAFSIWEEKASMYYVGGVSYRNRIVKE